MRASLKSALLVLATFGLPTWSVKSGEFKSCKDSAFCRRGRALAERAEEAASDWHSPYYINPDEIKIVPERWKLTAPLHSELYPDVKFELDVRAYVDGVFRVRADEVGGLKKRYDEAASWALIEEPRPAEWSLMMWVTGDDHILGSHRGTYLKITYKPLRIAFLRGDREEIVLNGQGLFHMEHFRLKNPPPVVSSSGASDEAKDQVVMESSEPSVRRSAWFEGAEEDGYWEETFKSWTDRKPKGPESLSVDIAFPGHSHVYGIPQHAAPLSLPTTTGPDSFFSDPYRLYNLDVFEYEASSTMPLYGAIPLMHAQSEDSTVGIFNAVASETYIDVSHRDPESTFTHWMSESGIFDIFLLPGPTPEAVFEQYAGLTGPPVLPALWSLGHHQCRWNYVSSDDVREVQRRFDEEDMPLDVLWLDIEYAEDHKYMIWNEKTFPDPVEMFNDVAAIERKMVVIVDPHLKRTDDYPVYREARDKDLLVKQSDGVKEYEGHCWSGNSAYVDWFNPNTWKWWQGLFSLQDKPGIGWRWAKSTVATYIWNDMNEPSVFNGPEVTMQKDMIHYGGWEHRDVHNINGMLFANQTALGLYTRENPAKRPFVLSRSFYAGSQRHGAIWTGDNTATWEHMAVGIPMVLSNGIAGMTFAGADVGGFFGNPSPELLVRFYQVGAFAPFFRAHAHIDTKRREPYLLDEPYKSIVRNILHLRYSLLPVWYTAFREASVHGIPVLRPHYVVFPKDKKGYAIDSQYFIGGSGLLVHPVTTPDTATAEVYLADNEVYYDYFTYTTYHGAKGGKNVTVPAPLEKVPLLIRGGHILPTRQRPRRSSPLMKYDPFTITVALNDAGSARGELYLDDGETYDNERGDLVWREFSAAKGSKKGSLTISSVDLVPGRPRKVLWKKMLLGVYKPDNDFAKTMKAVNVERIKVLGLTKKPKKVTITGSSTELEFSWTAGSKSQPNILIIKNPKTSIAENWSIDVE